MVHPQKYKTVKDFELYEVSIAGVLRRKPNKNGKKRARYQFQYSYPKGSISQKGYIVHKLYRVDGTTKTVPLHRIVAETYIDGDPNLHVNHKDGNKLNNQASNLEFVSNAENMAHAVKHGLINNRGENSGRNKIRQSTVEWILKNKSMPVREQASETGLSVSYIKSIRCGRRWGWLKNTVERSYL